MTFPIMNPNDLLQSKVPKCLIHVTAAPCPPVDERCEYSLSFSLLSKAGASNAEVLGHKLSAYNGRYQGDEFISPIELRWKDEDPVLIFDSDRDGYHGMLDSSAKLRGRGNASAFACSACASRHFEVKVQFDYADGVFDICSDDSSIDIENYFSNFLLVADCMECGKRSVVVDMDL